MKRQIEIKREFDKPPGEWDFKTQCFQKLTDPVDREFYEQHCKYVAICVFTGACPIVPCQVPASPLGFFKLEWSVLSLNGLDKSR